MTKLTIVAQITAKSAQVDSMKEELLKLIQPTLAEEGCVNYDLHQDNEDPAKFLFYENWETRELWQAHMETQHLKDYLEATEGKVEDIIISEMTPLS